MTRFVQISEIRDPVTDGAADSRTDCPWYLLNTRKIQVELAPDKRGGYHDSETATTTI